MNNYDVIVIGSGAAGMIAAITAAKDEKRVALLEQFDYLGAKLKATGGGRCNLSNTLDNQSFMESFGRNGRFMTEALDRLNHKDLMAFFNSIGVDTHIPDGFRIFPVTHKSSTIIKALEDELIRVGVEIKLQTKANRLLMTNDEISAVETDSEILEASKVVVATGGLGYPMLGANGDGLEFAKELGHKVTDLYPAMLPLVTKEKWVANCKADTIAKAEVRIDLKKARKLKAVGDLIFTNKGIRGPVVLDFSREITPYIDQVGEVPLLINMIRGRNEEQVYAHIKNEVAKDPTSTVLENLSSLLPESVANELCIQANADVAKTFKKLEGQVREKLVKLLVATPLTVIDSLGFKQAMITRGGVTLKQIDPKTMQSKIVKGLYFCGEVMDLDGPCGGYNLQWSFSSGHLAGKLFD